MKPEIKEKLEQICWSLTHDYTTGDHVEEAIAEIARIVVDHAESISVRIEFGDVIALNDLERDWSESNSKEKA